MLKQHIGWELSTIDMKREMFGLFAGMVSFFCIISKKDNNWSGNIFLSIFQRKKI